jgi:calcium/calmodulin-dependent protein kinase I
MFAPSQALKHKWMVGDNLGTEHDLSTGLRENWNPRQRWKSTVDALIASQRLAKAGASHRVQKDNSLQVGGTDSGNRSSFESFRTAESSDEALTPETRSPPPEPVPAVAPSPLVLSAAPPPAAPVQRAPERGESLVERATRAFGGLKTD